MRERFEKTIILRTRAEAAKGFQKPAAESQTISAHPCSAIWHYGHLGRSVQIGNSEQRPTGWIWTGPETRSLNSLQVYCLTQDNGCIEFRFGFLNMVADTHYGGRSEDSRRCRIR